MISPVAAELTKETLDQLTGREGNRRKRERRPYHVLQWAAPWSDGSPPQPEAFRQIRCHDISRGGISYFSDRPLLDEFLIVGLAAAAEMIYLKCRVANCVRVDQASGAFRVGCEFIERIELPPANQPPANQPEATTAARLHSVR
ncbi:MAG TPA: PilZ domain-containing protein [Pirellulales bacterium]|jgi:hypothetical protein|nr:PilZ domain-containing protein [Pirellulales bacterium]